MNKKFLPLLSCCLCLTVATSAWADLTGVKSVNKTDLTTTCREDNSLTVCNVFATFDHPDDRVIAVSAVDLQVFDGNTPATFFQVLNTFIDPLLSDRAPSSAFFPLIPGLVCDSYVTMGIKNSLAGDDTDTAACNDEIGEPALCDWFSILFNTEGGVRGTWFNGNLDGGQSDAIDGQVLIMQASFGQGLRMAGNAFVAWSNPTTGNQHTETSLGDAVFIECLAKCVPFQDCSDDDPCTENDACIEGICVGTPIDCPENPDPCLASKCADPDGDGIGQCVDNPVDGECDDGDPCTTGAICQDGQCGGGTPECVTAADCTDDGNECTTTTCEAGCCVTANNNNACDDGNDCTTGDTCGGGSCQPGTPDCATAGECEEVPDNPCTTDTCDQDGCCQRTNNTDSCEDGDPCTSGDQCADGACQSGPPECVTTADCVDDGNECTDTTCEAGCCVTTNNNNACDDGNDCTTGDTCGGGSCQPGTPDCATAGECEEVPDNPCTTDTCDQDGCCQRTNNTDPCDDNNSCTVGDTCADGGCVSGPPPNCSDAGDQCNTASCAPGGAEGNCDTLTPVDDDTECDDGFLCTTGDSCTGGDCGGIDVDCSEFGDEFVCVEVDEDPPPDGDGIGDCVEPPSGFLDIIPGKCPNRLRRNGLGWLKMALLGSDDPEAIDPCDVDPASIQLSRVGGDGSFVTPRQFPRPKCRDRGTPFLGELCDCHARRKDGIRDLDMRFKLQEVVNVLGLSSEAEWPAGSSAILRIDGETFGGQSIGAEDCVELGRDLGPNP